MSENLDNSGGNTIPTLALSATEQTTSADTTLNVSNVTAPLTHGAGINPRPPVVYPPGMNKNEKRKYRREFHMNQNRNMSAVLSSGGSNQSTQLEHSACHMDTPIGSRSSGRASTSVQHRLDINGNGRSNKRQRSNELNSSANRSKPKPKRHDAKNTPEARPGSSFANVVVDAYLAMAIIIAPADGVMVPCTRESFAGIFSALNELIFEDMDRGVTELPVFNQTHLRRGAVRIVCANSAARTWLEMNVNRLCAKTNMFLAVGEFDKVPRPAVFLAFFAYTKESTDKILLMLKRYNPVLSDVVFIVSRRLEAPNGTHLQIRVSQAVAPIIRASGGSFRFCMGECHFREILPKTQSNIERAQIQPVEAAMEYISETDQEGDVTIVNQNGVSEGEPMADDPPAQLDSGNAMSDSQGGMDTSENRETPAQPPVNLEPSDTQGGTAVVASTPASLPGSYNDGGVNVHGQGQAIPPA